jgi:hypothetical protein
MQAIPTNAIKQAHRFGPDAAQYLFRSSIEDGIKALERLKFRHQKMAAHTLERAKLECQTNYASASTDAERKAATDALAEVRAKLDARRQEILAFLSVLNLATAQQEQMEALVEQAYTAGLRDSEPIKHTRQFLIKQYASPQQYWQYLRACEMHRFGRGRLSMNEAMLAATPLKDLK